MQLSPISPQSKAPHLRFGSSGGGIRLDGMPGLIDAFFTKIQTNRSTEMITEDLVGFGALRTWMDLRRGKTYGNDSLNWPAAFERLARETASIVTDNILGGLVALGVGAAASKTLGKRYSNTFTNYATLELFQDALKHAPNQAAFLKQLAAKIHPNDPASFEKTLQTVWNLGLKDGKEQATEQAIALAQKLKWDKLDVRIHAGKQPAWFKLNELFDDVRLFSNHLKALETGSAKGLAWQNIAQDTLKKTLTLKNWKLGLGLSAALAATFGMPFLISHATKKYYGIDYYPGEIGLRKEDKDKKKEKHAGLPNPKGFLATHFPYIYDRCKNGNPLPLLVALLPLPFAVGVMNTQTRQWLNPAKNFRRLFDFCKEMPFTSPQQIAAGFALLITSRLLSSRTDNEFRERVVDSFAGWAIWIFGTPIIKQAIAKATDKNLLKTLQEKNQKGEWVKRISIRERAEIERLLPATREAVKKTVKNRVLLNAGSTVVTMLLLGIVEPWIGIKWTQYNEKHKQAEAAKKVAATFSNQNPATPLSNPLPIPPSLPAGNPFPVAVPFSERAMHASRINSQPFDLQKRLTENTFS